MSPASDVSPYGGLGLALIRTLVEQGRSTFTTAQARDAGRTVGVTDSYLPVLLHRLQRSGWLRRLKQGTYAMTTGLPGVSEAHAFAVGMALVDPCAISGWAALHHHGLTEQIPRVITLTTPKRVVTPAMRGAVRAAPSTWDVAGERYEIVVVVAAHYFGFEETWIDSARVRIFDRERALLDCFALPRRFGGLAEGLGMLDEHLREVNVERLAAHALEYGTAAVSKRVGYALEHLKVGANILEPLLALPLRGYRALDPCRAPHGPRNRRWGLIENLSSPRRPA
ncbi:MAG: type IV toxin-antitoxin system AbiEi family antitoxin domain-containing protein [Planctomycetota bacterium]|nr:type IV toxin-antitoxin system AbiEi family antitoxin domain-containing protein [Planctomycetota bacterium]